jgi:hypothetical protein
MKIIDRTPNITKKGEFSFTNKLKSILKFGFSWHPGNKAQQIVIEYLVRDLTDDYTLLCNISLPDSNVFIPLILLGPSGIYVIVTTNLKGNYQVRGNSWKVFTGGKARDIRPNLIMLTSKMAIAVKRYLAKYGVEISNVHGTLIATDSGMFILTVQPIVRVVMRDSLDQFVVSINNSFQIINEDLSQEMIKLLSEPPSISESDLDTIPIQQLLQATSKPSYFITRQWILLISLGVVELIILLFFFWLIFSNN